MEGDFHLSLSLGSEVIVGLMMIPLLCVCQDSSE